MPFFIFNLIITVIVVFSCCVYNELFVLFCCGLESNTHREIARRASEVDKDQQLMPDMENDDSDDEEEKNIN